jgi:hypothetical protein
MIERNKSARIAVIGWGSLIWNPGSLSLASRWRIDGPSLPIDYARISDDGRLTLVIEPTSKPVNVLWTIVPDSDLEQAIESLKNREGTARRHIHFATSPTSFGGAYPDVVKEAISTWLHVHSDIDACIWTGLPSNWIEKRNRHYTVADSLDYLDGVHDVGRVQEYVEKTPAQIETCGRVAIRNRFNWVNVPLPADLFETTSAHSS